MNAPDRAALLARLPIDLRGGPLVIDSAGRPIKPGMEVSDGMTGRGAVMVVDEDEGRIRIGVDWPAIPEDPDDFYREWVQASIDLADWRQHGVHADVFRCDELTVVA